MGPNRTNLQRQINFVDSLAIQKGSHTLKFGGDFRRLSPFFNPAAYPQDVFFSDVPSAENGNLSFSIVAGTARPTFLFRNLGLYVQDTWLISSRLTLLTVFGGTSTSDRSHSMAPVFQRSPASI